MTGGHSLPIRALQLATALLVCSTTGWIQPAFARPKLTAKAYVVLDASGRPLLQKNPAEVRSIASLTKLQAALVFRDRGLKLEAGTEITREDWKVALHGCRTRLELRWVYRNRDLLHAALMSSDNRAISALGRAVQLDAPKLVSAMNERARRLGLASTSFTCPVGIEPGNRSTALEVARIVRAASRDPILRATMSKREYQVKPLRGYLKVAYRNTNPLVGTSEARFIASKTGYNHVAGYCLATIAQLRGVGEVTIVLLGSRSKLDRNRDLRNVLTWLRGKRPIAGGDSTPRS